MRKSVGLIGPRCCGKTSVGGELMHRGPFDVFVDADHIFLNRHNMTIDDFIARFGIDKFREEGAAIIEEISGNYGDKSVVITPGGGDAAYHEQTEDGVWIVGQYVNRNVKFLRGACTLFYILPSEDLEKSAVELARRADEDKESTNLRPLLMGAENRLEEMRLVIPARHELYVAAAHHVLYTGEKKQPEIARDILDLL